MSVARRAGIPPPYVMDVWLAAAEHQRTKLASATFRIQTFSAFAKTDPYRDGTASTKVLIKPYTQGPAQTLAYRRICQKVRGSNPFGRTHTNCPMQEKPSGRWLSSCSVCSSRGAYHPARESSND